jgi:hypothetical protein
MKVRNITGDPVFVPVLGRVVELDEVVEVPAHAKDLVWPEANWEVISTARKPVKESE